MGTALVPLKVPLKPKLTEAPLPSWPLYDSLAAVTAAPLWVILAFHPLETFWLPAKDQPTFQEDFAAELLVRVTLAVNPPLHELCTWYFTVQAAAAAAAVEGCMAAATPPAPATIAKAESKAVLVRRIVCGSPCPCGSTPPGIREHAASRRGAGTRDFRI